MTVNLREARPHLPARAPASGQLPMDFRPEADSPHIKAGPYCHGAAAFEQVWTSSKQLAMGWCGNPAAQLRGFEDFQGPGVRGRSLAT